MLRPSPTTASPTRPAVATPRAAAARWRPGTAVLAVAGGLIGGQAVALAIVPPLAGHDAGRGHRARPRRDRGRARHELAERLPRRRPRITVAGDDRDRPRRDRHRPGRPHLHHRAGHRTLTSARAN